ncbi:MAG: MBL fold metallo-hydrolase [Christiangramia sp.]|nr:MBL fold metallo-hydrolase [Christiangramia sp.]
MLKQFGANPGGERQARIESCNNYENGAFQNVLPTQVSPENSSFLKMLWKFMNKPANVRPQHNLPSVSTNLKELPQQAFVWFGHSSYLLKLHGKTILIDPVFSGNAAPVSFFGKAFPGADVYKAEDMPKIDLLLLTHDHYDHLDYLTVSKLKPKVSKIVTSLGVGSHLQKWGFSETIITELNWWDSAEFWNALKITAAPARHFSGRSFSRFKTLWSSFILQFEEFQVYLGGDSGYSNSFQDIGKRFGPFDLAVMECGQYNENWPEIHMFPEQSVQAALDLQAKMAIPVHHSKFALAMHPWNEPLQRFHRAASEKELYVVSPMIGEVYNFSEDYQQKEWWIAAER